MAEDKPCQWLCENRTFSAEETKLLHKRITQGYNVHLYVADYSSLKPDFYSFLQTMIALSKILELVSTSGQTNLT